jgi:hypothetical protein
MGTDSSTYGRDLIKNKIYRTDNCVKNHFYSNLRKSLRKLNLII